MLCRGGYICGLMCYHFFPYQNDPAVTGVILSIGLVDLLFIFTFSKDLSAVFVLEVVPLFSWASARA